MFNDISLNGHLRQIAEAETAQNQSEYVPLDIAIPGKLEERHERLREPH